MARSLVLEIDGMSCGHCVQTVEKALRKIAGVQVASVVVGRATIEVDDEALSAAARAAVEKAGFTCRSIAPKTP